MKLDLSLLVLRIGFGGVMLLAHGLPKLMSYSERANTFADPIGLGSNVSLILAIGAEVFCALAVTFGLFTRLAAVPLAFTMFVAAIVVHAGDPWQKKELAVMYFIAFVAIIVAGPGRFSLDTLFAKLGIFQKKKK
ncbi:MAG TPA: DoxX family protein [Bdellovibrionales bacterium]|nr:DoxX family protein [Bdellovibrionales bacterium]